MPPQGDELSALSRGYGVGAGVNVDLKLEAPTAAVTGLSTALAGLKSALSDLNQSASGLVQSINNHLRSIGSAAEDAAAKVTSLTTAASGIQGMSSGGSGGGPPNNPPGGGGGGSPPTGPSSWVSRAGEQINSVVNKDRAAGLSLGTFIGTGNDKLADDLVLAPFRYLRSRINTNRDTALMSSGVMNMSALQQGARPQEMMSALSRFPGNVQGTPQDLLSMFSAAPALGASYGFGGGQGQGVRAAGFFKGVREAQMLNPMAQVGGAGGLVDTIGGYAADTGAQQKAMMLTGGSMGMIATGGRQKSLSEWAESILRWFEGLRPGKDRGKPFDYGTLMAQYFPGSNIDAWFNTTGVPQNMRDYWWTYALGKTNKIGSSQGAFKIGTEEGQLGPSQDNVAWQRLKSTSELTRTEFSLGAMMTPQYAQRESSNRWFNELMGNMQEKIIPQISNSIFRMIQYLPDSLEDLLMTGAERGIGALLGDVDSGDIGDTGIGDSYGDKGGTGLSGLHPDMKSKVGAMMKANPKLRVNSGLRDTGLQQKLKAKGHSRVSGKPSAHTRGMAADLGPKSQYNWIAKNAKKFGLASGKGHGEPWHVGMPGDIPGIGDIGDPFNDFLDLIQGAGSSAEGMAGLVTKILDLVTGGLGKFLGGDQPTDQFASSPDDLYAKLVGASQNVELGKQGLKASIAGSGAFWLDPVGTTAMLGAINAGGGGGTSTTASGQSVAGTPSGWAANHKTWVGTNPSGRGDRYNQTAGPDIMSMITSSDVMTRGKAVAKVLSQAGFHGQALKDFMRISYRESHWTNNAWNSGPVDESGGILQANQLPWVKKGNPAPFTQADLMDPLAAAHVAYDQYMNNAPLNGPGGKPTMQPWTVGGNWQGGIPGEAAGYTDTILRETGLGDIDAMQAGLGLVSTVRRDGAAISFNNTFHLAVPGYGGGSNGGMDARRTAVLLADHLEDEMNRRMKRSA